MKKVTIAICLLMLSMTAHTQTTLEEYNYLTKGYKIQIESGLDMKKGYTLKYLLESVIQFKTKFYGLYRDDETSPCAILAIQDVKTLISPTTYYICIPHYKSSSEIWDKFRLQNINGIDITVGFAKCAAYFAQNN